MFFPLLCFSRCCFSSSYGSNTVGFSAINRVCIAVLVTSVWLASICLHNNSSSILVSLSNRIDVVFVVIYYSLTFFIYFSRDF